MIAVVRKEAIPARRAWDVVVICLIRALEAMQTTASAAGATTHVVQHQCGVGFGAQIQWRAGLCLEFEE